MAVLSIAEFARRVGRQRKQIYRDIKQGKLKLKKRVVHMVGISESDVKKYSK